MISFFFIIKSIEFSSAYFDNNINEERIVKINKLLQQLNSILANYAEENAIDLIIKKKDIIIGKSSLDITDDIMKIFNNKVKQLN